MRGENAGDLAAEARRRRQSGSQIPFHPRAGGTRASFAGVRAPSRHRQNSLAAKLAGSAGPDDGQRPAQTAATNGAMPTLADSTLFNQTVQKLDETLNHLPTIAVVKF